MSHYPIIEIPFADSGKWLQNEVLALARWSQQGADTLVVFVHGFGGKATTTWPRFDSLLPAQAATTDIVFFQYDGIFNSVDVSAGFFRRLLDDLIAAPADVIKHTLGSELRPGGFRYSRIVLASHSTGALIVRRALLDGLRSALADHYRKAPIRLVFYAPAHSGARTAQLVSMAATGQGFIVSSLGKLALVKSPLLLDLDPQKSVALPRLERETRNWLKQKGAPRDLLVAHRVIHAQNDTVVYSYPFCEDSVDCEILPGEDHCSVCKPKDATETKYRRLIDALFNP